MTNQQNSPEEDESKEEKDYGRQVRISTRVWAEMNSIQNEAAQRGDSKPTYVELIDDAWDRSRKQGEQDHTRKHPRVEFPAVSKSKDSAPNVQESGSISHRLTSVLSDVERKFLDNCLTALREAVKVRGSIGDSLGDAESGRIDLEQRFKGLEQELDKTAKSASETLGSTEELRRDIEDHRGDRKRTPRQKPTGTDRAGGGG